MSTQTQSKALKIAKQYFNDWNNRKFAEAENRFSETAIFDTPINTYDNKQGFMAAVRFTADAANSIKLIAEFGNEHDAMLLYDLDLMQVGIIRIAEYFKVENDRITSIWHIHDTTLLRSTDFEKD